MPNGSGGFDCFHCIHLDIREGMIEGNRTFYNIPIESVGYTVCHDWMPKISGISEQRIKELVKQLAPSKLNTIDGMGSISPAKDLPPQSLLR
jgi:hypothetical protein